MEYAIIFNSKNKENIIIKINYIPIIDELSYFVLHRARKYYKNKLLKNKGIHQSVRIGDYCKIDKNVAIGRNTYLGDFCHIFSGSNSKVVIGDYCAIGNNVHIKARTHDLKRPTPTKKYNQNKRIEKDILIGDNVWIGDNVFIREGITIESDAVIAANSVIVKNVKEREIVGGVPAKHIRMNEELLKEE